MEKMSELKPYPCEFCDKSFTHYSSKHRHVNQAHKEGGTKSRLSTPARTPSNANNQGPPISFPSFPFSEVRSARSAGDSNSRSEASFLSTGSIFRLSLSERISSNDPLNLNQTSGLTPTAEHWCLTENAEPTTFPAPPSLEPKNSAADPQHVSADLVTSMQVAEPLPADVPVLPELSIEKDSLPNPFPVDNGTAVAANLQTCMAGSVTGTFSSSSSSFSIDAAEDEWNRPSSPPRKRPSLSNDAPPLRMIRHHEIHYLVNGILALVKDKFGQQKLTQESLFALAKEKFEATREDILLLACSMAVASMEFTTSRLLVEAHVAARRPVQDEGTPPFPVDVALQILK